MLRAFGDRVVMCCDMLGVVGSSLKMVKFEPTTPNMSQHGGQTRPTMLRCVVLACRDRLAGALCRRFSTVVHSETLNFGGKQIYC